jgi:hypothetical protein
MSAGPTLQALPAGAVHISSMSDDDCVPARNTTCVPFFLPTAHLHPEGAALQVGQLG